MIETVTGDDVASFVVPVTLMLLAFTILLSVGEVSDNVGGTVSTVNVKVFCVAALAARYILVVKEDSCLTARANDVFAIVQIIFCVGELCAAS